jgi:hypothetical protein
MKKNEKKKKTKRIFFIALLWLLLWLCIISKMIGRA